MQADIAIKQQQTDPTLSSLSPCLVKALIPSDEDRRHKMPRQPAADRECEWTIPKSLSLLAVVTIATPAMNVRIDIEAE